MQRVITSFLGVLLCLQDVSAQTVPVEDMKTLDILMNTTADVIHDSSAIVNDMESIRIRHRNTPEYECGYLNKVLEEFFRKQVNVYNTSKYMNGRLYTNELILYLEEIEHHYWQIEHVAHMLHEVERKHKIGVLQANFQNVKYETPVLPVDAHVLPPKDQIELSPELGRIFGELSWISRLQLLDKYYPAANKTVMSMESLMEPTGSEHIVYSGFTPSNYVPPRLPPHPEVYPGPPAQQPRQPPLSRRADRLVGISALKLPGRLVAGRRQTPSGDFPQTNPPPYRDDETSMKLKLFRLMYETVRDSDLKVKRAELIKTQYANSSAFEVGYLLGDISDKYNIMSDIATTLQRLYGDWRPIEHINAYEQIANQAIEISHLIDLAKTVHKRNENGS